MAGCSFLTRRTINSRKKFCLCKNGHLQTPSVPLKINATCLCKSGTLHKAINYTERDYKRLLHKHSLPASALPSHDSFVHLGSSLASCQLVTRHAARARRRRSLTTRRVRARRAYSQSTCRAPPHACARGAREKRRSAARHTTPQKRAPRTTAINAREHSQARRCSTAVSRRRGRKTTAARQPSHPNNRNPSRAHRAKPRKKHSRQRCAHALTAPKTDNKSSADAPKTDNKSSAHQ